MIELANDTLSFAFPELAADARARAEAYLAEALPRVLRQDRAAALEQLLREYDYAAADEAFREKARARVRAATDEEVGDAFARAVRAAAPQTLALRLEFQRTLRLPDDGREHPLPPGLGRFPLRRIEDLGERVPAAWSERGGVAMPMHQAEALWLYFSADLPVALKVGAGGINAVTGEGWGRGLHAKPQDYLVLPGQPWLDGFCVARGVVRQFVAMPLGQGYTAEEQLTGQARTGGVQLQAYPLRAEPFFREQVEPRLPRDLGPVLRALVPPPPSPRREITGAFRIPAAAPGAAMGLGAGGKLRQQIYEDRRDVAKYDEAASVGCFVHILNSQAWAAAAGSPPPHPPPSAQDYARAHLPWFDYYRDDLRPVAGAGVLDKLRSVFQVARQQAQPLPDGDSLPDLPIVHLGPPGPGSVRGWRRE